MGIGGVPGDGLHGASYFHGRGERSHAFPVGVNGPHPPVEGCFSGREGGQVHQDLVRINALVIVQMVFHRAVPVQVLRQTPEDFHFVAHRFRIFLPGEKDELFLLSCFFLHLGWKGPFFSARSQGTLEELVFYRPIFCRNRKGKGQGQKGRYNQFRRIFTSQGFHDFIPLISL